MTTRLWNYFDVNGQQEPFLDNPPLYILNPKKRGKRTMKRRRKARITATRRAPRRRTTARRRRSVAMASNPPRRARRRHARRAVARRRGFRRNPPDILGFNFKDVAIAGAAVIVAPMLEKQIMGFMPASLSGTTAGRWGVKVGTAVLIGYGAKKVLGGKYGNLALIALGANIVADAVAEFAPTLTGGTGAYVRSAGMGAYVSRYRSNGLGAGPSARGAFTGVDRGTLLPMTSLNDPLRSVL